MGKVQPVKSRKTNRIRIILILLAALIVIGAVLLFVLSPDEKAASDNLLVNGDFSALDSDGIPDGWYTDSWNTGADVTEYSAENIDGVNCFYIRNYSENDARLAQYVQVEPDSYYCLEGSVWAEADGGWGANLSVENVLKCSRSVYSTGDQWEKVTYWGKTSSYQTGITVFLRLGGYSAESAGIAWFADVSLKKYDELPAGVIADHWFVGEDEAETGAEAEEGPTALSATVTILFSALAYIVLADLLLVWARRERQELNARFSVTEYITLFVVLAAAMVARILSAVQVRGYDIDINDFTAWARDIKDIGTSGFYTKVGFCDYPPGYLLVLLLTSLFGQPTALGVKMPSVLCDLILATLIAVEGRKYTTTRKALAMGLLYLLCPVTVCTGAAWGQSDAVMALFLGFCVLLVLRHQWAAALPVYTISVLMKPQALMFGPLGVAALVLDLVLTAVHKEKDTAEQPDDKKKSVSLLKKRLTGAGIGIAASAAVLGIIFLLFTDMTALKQGVGMRADAISAGETAEVAYTFECDDVYVSFYDDAVSAENGEDSGSASREAETEALLLDTTVYCYTDGSAGMVNRGGTIVTGSWGVEDGSPYLILGNRSYLLRDDYAEESDSYRSRYSFTWAQDTEEAYYNFTFSCRGQSADWLIKLYQRTLSSYDFCTVNGCNTAFLAGENWQDAGTTSVRTLVLILSRLAYLLPLALCCITGKNDRKKSLLYLLLTWLALGEGLLYLYLNAGKSGITAGNWGTFMIVLSVVFALWMLLQGKDLKHLPLVGAVLLLLLFNTGTKMHERYLFPALMLLVIAFIAEKDRRIIWLLLGVSAFSLMNVGCVLDRNLRIGGADGHLSAPAFGLESDMAFLEYMSAAGNYLCTLLGVWIAADLCLMHRSPLLLPSLRTGEGQQRTAGTGENGGTGGKDGKDTAEEKTGRMTGRDWLIVGVATVLYTVFALTNLGSFKAPQTEYTYRNTAVFDLGESHSFALKLYIEPDYEYGRLTVSTAGEDGDFALRADQSLSGLEGTGWRKLEDSAFEGRYVKIDFSRCYGANIGEILCFDTETGERLPLILADGFEGHKALCDEQMLLDDPVKGLSERLQTALGSAIASEQELWDLDGEAYVSVEGFLSSTYAALTGALMPVPETYYDSELDENVLVFDLGEHRDFNVLYYSGIQWQDSYSCEMRVSDALDDAGDAYMFDSEDGDCFTWKYVCGRDEVLSGRYLKLNVTDCLDMSLFEILCRDALTGEPVPLRLISGPKEAAKLCDEPDSLEGEPSWWNSTYFDEIYHARTAYEHLHGLRVYETTHPPLGKVIMSWSVGIFGMCPFGWRLPGALCGVLMLPAIYMIARLLMKKRRYAVGAMLILTFDCMHFTQTRIATIDSFVVLFILWSVYFMFYWMKQDYFGTKYWKTFLPLMASGVFMGLSVASKWTGCYNGIGLAVLFFVTWVWRLRQVMKARKQVRSGDFGTCSETEKQRLTGMADRGYLKLIGTLASCIVFFIAVPLLIYYCSYIPYFAYDGGITVEKVIEAAVGRYFVTGEVGGMLGYHATPGLGMDHYFYSPWYEWPIDAKPMWFYSGSYSYDSRVGSTIMTMGNPAVWWGGLLAMLVMIVMIYVYARYRWSRRWDVMPAALKENHGMQWLLVVFAAQFLPWTLVPRGTYIYHYFACVPVIILALMCVLSTLEQLYEEERVGRAPEVYAISGTDGEGLTKAGVKERLKFIIARLRPMAFPMILIAYITVCLVLFIAFFPYASGIEVSKKWLEGMRWFDNWLWY